MAKETGLKPHNTDSVLFDADTIATRIAGLGREIAESTNGNDLIIVGVLRGSFMFLADLSRQLHAAGLTPRIDFMTLESYHSGTTSSGVVRIIKDCSLDLRDQHIVLVDDILDTGRTLTFAKRHLENKGAKSIQTCVLLDKPSRRVVPEMNADHIGFEIEDTFVVGFGLDYDGRYRELPQISEVTFT